VTRNDILLLPTQGRGAVDRTKDFGEKTLSTIRARAWGGQSEVPSLKKPCRSISMCLAFELMLHLACRLNRLRNYIYVVVLLCSGIIHDPSGQNTSSSS
jgi:hypothetical protein